MTMRLNIRAHALVAVTILSASALRAQTDTATITGVVTDSSGAIVPGVRVEVQNSGTAAIIRAVSNEAGVFVATALPIGVYTVTVAMDGFQTVKQPGIALHAGDRTRVDIQLKPGQISEVLTVTSQAPLLESENSSLSQVVENTTIANMPLNGRNYQQLAMLAPGVIPARVRNSVTDAFSVNGASMFQNQFVMDGMDNNNYITGVATASNQVMKPSVDAIQEFKMETHNYSAEFGRGGGGVMQVSTKSGTNQIHGSAFEFLRNDKLDANNFFNSGRAKPPYRMNQFGGTLGGPVRRDRTFAFGSYQGTRVREQITRLSALPAKTQIGGDFGTAAVYDPATQNAAGVRQPFPNNRIPSNRFDPVSKRLLDLYPAPNREGVQNFVYNAPQTDDVEQVDARLDHTFSERDTMFLRYSYHNRDKLESGTLPSPANGGDTLLRKVGAHTAVFNETHVFGGGRLVNELRLAYSRNRADSDTTTTDQLWKTYGFKGLIEREDNNGLPLYTVSGLASIGDRATVPDPKTADVQQFIDNLTWTQGRHSVRFGGNVRSFRRYAGTMDSGRGRFTFNGQFTTAQAGRGTGLSLADALLGLTSNAQLMTPRDVTQISWAYEGYVQDNVKLTRKLTLNLGLRYEFQQPYWERHDRAANFIFDQGLPNYGALVNVSGTSVEDRSFQQTDRNNFAPRIGFAYQAAASTVVRGSYGIFYDNISQLPASSQPVQNPPFFLSTTIPTSNSSSRSNLQVQDGFPANALDPARIEGRSLVSVWPFAFPEGVMHQWNLNVQRSLPSKILVSAAYVGSNIVHRKLIGMDRNQPYPGASSINSRRVFPQYADIQSDIPVGTANYQGLEMRVERRFGGGFSTLNGYTWSHALAGEAGQDTRVAAAEKALSQEDMRHRFFSTVVYELPLGTGKRWLTGHWLRHFAGGWQLSTLFVAQSGMPFSPALSTNPANVTGTVRPNRIGEGNLDRDKRTPEAWFDRTAFTVPAAYTFGNSGRNVLTGPGVVNLDTTVARMFKLTESVRLDFRAEFFNILNEAHFGFPNAQVDRPVGGQISSTSTPARQIQFALKVLF
jgi:hypothetical protein